MIHVLDYKGNIIDYIEQDDNAVISAEHHRNINDHTETFDFTILSEKAENLQDRNRIIIQDSNDQYREFIITHVSQDIDGYTEIETDASYLEDITFSMPYAPGQLTSMTTSEALRDVLKDTGWQVSDKTEYGGTKTTKWDSYQTRYEVLMQLCTTYEMIPDFYIEIGTNKVEGRYVTLKFRNPLFNGKEIVYGKDLLEMKRTVDMSEINTALLVSGPQRDNDQPPITLTVKDDEANNRYSLPGRYLWGVYSPEAGDSNMTKEQLTELATNELDKRKAAAISYEVKSTDIKRYYPHEVIHLGDQIRVKNEDFIPSLYLEAEVIGEDFDLISGDSEYVFGQYKEYTESELKKSFTKRLADIQRKMYDNINNINTIIQQTQEGNLEYFEQKIIKSSTPPKNPVNDMLWYDTSNPKVAVLRRYFNGEWIEQTAENVEQIGGVTREKALYSELNNTFINLTIQHSRLLSDVYEVINSEYLVDNQLKTDVNNKLNDTINVFNQIKANLEGMKPETATIGELVDTQALFLEYREKMQALYTSVETAKIAIDKRFKLLQSQYTDQKFNDAMDKVAQGINGTWDKDKGQLIAKIPNQQEIENALKTYIDTQDKASSDAIYKLITDETNSKFVQNKEELSNSIKTVSNKVDGITIGGRNLLRNSLGPFTTNNYMFQDFPITTKLNAGDTVTLSVKGELGPDRTAFLVYNSGGMVQVGTLEGSIRDNNGIFTKTFTWTDTRVDGSNKVDSSFLRLYQYPSTAGSSSKIEWAKLERGNKVTDYTRAPEDTENTLNQITTTQTQQNTDIKQLKDTITLKADKTEVKTIFDDNIKPLQSQVNDQKAQLDVLPSQINSKVSQSTYTTDQNNIITRLNSADTQRQQLSNAINDRVTINQFNDLKVGTRNLLLNGGYNSGLSYWRNVGKATPENKVDSTFTGLPSDLSNVAIVELDDYANTEKGIAQDGLNLEIGKEYILSAWIKVITGGPTVRLQEGKSRWSSKNFDATTEWKRYEYKFKAVEQPTNVYIIIPKGTANAKIAVTGVQLVEGNMNTDFKLSDKDTDKTLTTMQTQINQNGTNINLRATKDEFNATNKTLSKAISDLTINTTTGLTLKYDDNGTIQSSTVGPNGVTIKGDRVDITVNKDFQVMTSTVNNKVGKNEVVNSINVSKEGIAIDANKVGIRGGNGTTYLDIQNTKLLSRGFFERKWGDKVETPYCKLGIYDGHIILQNETSGKNLYMTEKGLSTTMQGDLDSLSGSGTLEFQYEANDDNTMGVRLHSYYGIVYIQSQYNRVFLRSTQTMNIETWDASVYVRPYLGTRSGRNEFAFKTVDASFAGDQDGLLVFGEISTTDGLAGSGLRFKKKGIKGNTSGDYEPIVYATDNAGNPNMGSFSGLSFYGDIKTRTTHLYIMANSSGGEIRATSTTGEQGSSTVYVPVRSSRVSTQSALAFTNHSNGGTYFGVGADAGNKLYITDNNGYNNGKPQWRPVVASAFTNGSKAEYKKDIKSWHGDALSVIKDTDLYTFQYRDSHDNMTHHGVIIGKDYNTPEEFIQDEGVNLYDMITYSIRAIQQLNDKVESLQAQLDQKNDLEERLNTLEKLLTEE